MSWVSAARHANARPRFERLTLLSIRMYLLGKVPSKVATKRFTFGYTPVARTRDLQLC